jgi:type VI secretion system protein ImpA
VVGTDSGAIETVETSGFERVVDVRILAPISGSEPAGEDIRRLPLWVEIRAARPRTEANSENQDWQPAQTAKTTWLTYKEIVERTLCTRSKDLELGLFLMEACTRLYGFKGVRDGCWVLRGLVCEFKERGLFPEAENGDFEVQSRRLEWVSEKLPDIVREIPLTKREPPGKNYSLNYRDESIRQNGMITAAEFEAAASAGTLKDYTELLDEIAAASTELDLLKQATLSSYGEESPSYAQIAETLVQCSIAVKSILAKRSPQVKKSAGPDPLESFFSSRLIQQTSASDPWSECERVAESGEIDNAIAQMTALAASEPNGRVRFQRKLLLADLCYKTNRKRLATSILEELNEILVDHKLESWETSEVVGGVWSRLVRSYRDTLAGTANQEKEREFYLKLSRLDPWQALSCGEPTRKE